MLYTAQQGSQHMPYASDRQRRFFNANRAQLATQGVDVNEWNSSSRGLKLPEQVQDGKPVKGARKPPRKPKVAFPLSSLLGTLTKDAQAPLLAPILARRVVNLALAGYGSPQKQAQVKFPQGSGSGNAIGGDPSVLDSLENDAFSSQGKTAAIQSTPFLTPNGHNNTPNSLTPAEAQLQGAQGPLGAGSPLELTKVALACLRRDQFLTGASRKAWLDWRPVYIKQSMLAGPSGSQVGPAADAVSMLHGQSTPNPLAGMQANPLAQQNPIVGAPGGMTSPSQNPINAYGPLNQAGTVGGGMFGQKNTEGGSLKLASPRLWEKISGPNYAGLVGSPLIGGAIGFGVNELGHHAGRFLGANETDPAERRRNRMLMTGLGAGLGAVRGIANFDRGGAADTTRPPKPPAAPVKPTGPYWGRFEEHQLKPRIPWPDTIPVDQASQEFQQLFPKGIPDYEGPFDNPLSPEQHSYLYKQPGAAEHLKNIADRWHEINRQGSFGSEYPVYPPLEKRNTLQGTRLWEKLALRRAKRTAQPYSAVGRRTAASPLRVPPQRAVNQSTAASTPQSTPQPAVDQSTARSFPARPSAGMQNPQALVAAQAYPSYQTMYQEALKRRMGQNGATGIQNRLNKLTQGRNPVQGPGPIQPPPHVNLRPQPRVFRNRLLY
jgi:hypothetical protein